MPLLFFDLGASLDQTHHMLRNKGLRRAVASHL
jgi:hypothetical protein